MMLKYMKEVWTNALEYEEKCNALRRLMPKLKPDKVKIAEVVDSLLYKLIEKDRELTELRRADDWQPIETAIGLVVTEYRFVGYDETDIEAPVFTRMTSPFYKGVRWAIRVSAGRMCLNRYGEWEIEPLPSNRDDAFYARCRFDTLGHAVETYELYCKPLPDPPQEPTP